MKLKFLKSQLLLFFGLFILLIIDIGFYGQFFMPVAIIFMVVEFLPYILLVFVYNMLITWFVFKKSFLLKYVLPIIPLVFLFFYFRDEYGYLQLQSCNDKLKINLQGLFFFIFSLSFLNYLAYRILNKK